MAKMATTLRRSALQFIRKHTVAVNSVAVRHKSSKSEEKYLLTSVYKDVQVTNDLISDFVWQNLDRWPEKTATVCALTGRGYTYAQSHKMSLIFAAALRTKLKLKDGDKVAVILPNMPEYPSALLGVLQAGCIASMMNHAYTAYELQKQLQTVPCEVIITSKVSYPNIKEALNALKLNTPVIMLDNDSVPEGTIKFEELAGDLNTDIDVLKSVKRNADDVAVLPFSSGTTGLPKGVVLTHKCVVAENRMIADPEVVAIKETTATYQSVLPAILPFFHIFGFNALMLNQMHLGCKLVTMPYFKPDLFLQTIVSHKAHVLFIVPPMAIFLGKHPAVTPKHLESLHGLICGAAPLSESDIAAVIQKNKNINFRQGYGLTETNGGTSVGKRNDTNHSSVGHVFGSCQVKIADIKTQEALGPNQEGEIWVRGPLLMREYYNNEAATKEVMQDGWFKTGDVGKYDDKKYLYVTDRLKELIKVKGFQVPPAELETVVRTHPKVLDCAVLGIPDPISGEAPKAFIVLQPGQNVDPKEILNYVNSKVADFKNLKDVQVIEEIPKNPAGKILRKNLKEKYC
ncbi:4-coumarate--CoA ligase 1-like isoform X2 [Hyposmocoma kahamanoa]|nr:4-coumarate--CoA ligase 1-like isoform X2 [Hyposmocoma kahamanoa]XP_026332500.1 4-coumarate--CoA ligase 1-like isoform X2 [Hyposmocoma kahamanoa]XP_026332501.1 4-coumarate--CoA ligase 1-like isoform X2 [Hyposmocoma kahamanoa]XP_026332502.1 4-coumarate--CoA ligase 1-like isoform X2 [Hyposmocoma kahamanoa]